MNRKRSLIDRAVWLTAYLLAPAVALGQGSNVSATKHNLTASGPGPVRVLGMNNVCTPCHTPHSSNPIGPLWNRNDSGAYYQVYQSPTLAAVVPQPTGSSRLCLSCHDGTIALGQTHNPKNRVGGSIYISPSSSSYIGTDLRGHHPISFVYDAALAIKTGHLRDPSSLPRPLFLDQEHRLQCTTCHDPHDDTLGFFLRMDNHQSRMCVTCHDFKNWPLSVHATATASVGSVSQEHWRKLRASTVRDLGCESCHRPHSAGGREWLLYYEAEQDNCLVCHNGSAGKDVASQFLKPFRHPVEQGVRVHSPNEDPATMSMHVKCGDCHDPHETVLGTAARAPLIKPAMSGATGTTRVGRGASAAEFEYQVCYKCHGWRNPARPVVNRVIVDPNIGNRLDPSNASYHPVVARGKNMQVPSLSPPRQPTDMIYCTDCHSSDSGARGPHGSIYSPLLARNYVTIDNTGEGPQAYDLCYGCHNRVSILADQSFPKHKLHIADKHAPCSLCHDPHGVAANAHLINFDRERVLPANGVGPSYHSLGLRRGSCTLVCHGEVHINKQYQP